MRLLGQLTRLSGLLLAGILLLSGCDQLSKLFPGSDMPGTIQGTCLDMAGHTYGLVSVVLRNSANGQDEYTQPADSSGTFLFQNVKPGKYTLITYTVDRKLLANDGKEIKLGPGRTVLVTLTLDDGGTSSKSNK